MNVLGWLSSMESRVPASELPGPVRNSPAPDTAAARCEGRECSSASARPLCAGRGAASPSEVEDNLATLGGLSDWRSTGMRDTGAGSVAECLTAVPRAWTIFGFF